MLLVSDMELEGESRLFLENPESGRDSEGLTGEETRCGEGLRLPIDGAFDWRRSGAVWEDGRPALASWGLGIPFSAGIGGTGCLEEA
jgi:hypothetical protein